MAWVVVACLCGAGQGAWADPGLSVDSLTELSRRDPVAAAKGWEELSSSSTLEVAAFALFRAARLYELELGDAEAARRLYRKLRDEYPNSGEAAAATTALLRLGDGDPSSDALAKLRAAYARQRSREILEQAETLAKAAGPTAAQAGLWVADTYRDEGDCGRAVLLYADVATRFAGGDAAVDAVRGEAECALQLRRWRRALALAEMLPAADPRDQVLRDSLRSRIAELRARARLGVGAWIAVVFGGAGLLLSWADGVRRSSRGWRGLRPPAEARYVLPVFAVLVGAAYTGHADVWPAVQWIALGGVGVAWASGAGLRELAAAGAPLRLRTAIHVVLSVAVVGGVAYIAVQRDGLYDQVAETVRFGPER